VDWRESFLLWFGPGILGGVTFGDWLSLLRANRFDIDPPYWIRAAAITFVSLGNSVRRAKEEAAYKERIAETKVEPPLFVLGIWRSGTTHLQNLFAVDDRFAYPNVYQTTYPHTFLSSEAVATRRMRFVVPEKRLQDNMRFGLDLPCEDELAIAIATLRSLMLSLVFPRRAAHYDRFLTLRGLPDDDVQIWKDGLLWFVRKLTWKYRKPLVLKSPMHTGRIKVLLDVFPDARFVHIHRDPYAVFPSSRHTLLEGLRFFSLQRHRFDLDERTIRSYQEIVDAFFEEKPLIRADRFCEVCFEELERDPIGQMRRVYEALKLPDFSVVELAMTRYVATLRDYKKNEYPALAPELRERIAREWRRSFEAWGYPV
jgi:hypothetical protein